MSEAGATKEDVAALNAALSDGQFHKARHLNISPRLIRAICTACPDIFLSGQEGYKRVDRATQAEVENSINHLRSRARYITQRADRLEAVMIKVEG